MSEVPASESHLSFPSTSSKPASPPPPEPTPREILKNRLYVGNLHSSVDEYAFLQVFSKFGKVSKLDFLFHKAGPNKGKPRGYAFVEYADKDDASKALLNAHDKLLRGRKLVVTFANQAPEHDSASRPSYRRGYSEANRPTALSMLKSLPTRGRTEDKIALLEAKLKDLQHTPEPAEPIVLHPSLPPRPVASAAMGQTNTTPIASQPGRSSTGGQSRPSGSRVKPPLSTLGKKPTLEELMKASKKGQTGGLLPKR